ncbi:MAG: diguanylate cyclase [Magnetococcus sp. MYC-9]
MSARRLEGEASGWGGALRRMVLAGRGSSCATSLLFWTLSMAVLLTVSVGFSLHLSLQDATQQTMTLAVNTARANFAKDLSLRQWATRHGGVYVPVDERTPPNPNLAHIPERDISTPSGKRLTLMNPAYMLRQVMEEHADPYGTQGRITSLKPLNPANAPDPWEERVLRLFESGTEEAMEVVGEGLDATLRLMRPMVTQDGCLKCHAFQGYKVGDVRGGIGVRVPLRGFRQAEATLQRNTALAHAFFWGFGMVLLGLYARVSRARAKERTDLQETEARLRAMTESLRDALVVFDADGVIHYCSHVCAEMFGWHERDLHHGSIAALFDESWLGPDWRMKLLSPPSGQDGPLYTVSRGVGRRRDGQGLPVEISISQWQRHGENFCTAIIRDITHLKMLEARDLRAYVNRIAISALLEISIEPLSLSRKLEVALEIILTVPWLAVKYKGSIFLATEDEHLEMVAQRNLHSHLLHACHQIPFGFCLCGRAAQSRQVVFSSQLDARHDITYNGIVDHGHYCVPILLQKRLLGVLNLYVDHGHPYDPEEEAFLTTIANTLAGVIDRGRADDRVQYMASHDALTGLPNRMLFHELLNQEVRRAARYQQILAVGFIDLDHFKKVNDTLGHEAGDLLLQAVSTRTRQQLRDSDTLARLGGDEFTLILPAIGDRENAVSVCGKIVRSLGEPFLIRGHACQIGASIGLSLFPAHGQSIADLLQAADHAMYVVKKGGRNGVVVYGEQGT